MATIIKRPFTGRGKIYLGAVGGALYPVGNADKAEISAKEDTDKVTDYTTGAGGVYAASSMISEVNLSVSLVDHNPRNMAIALLGSATAVNSGTVTAEVVTSAKGALVPLARVGATSHVVKNTGGTVTYVLGSDYEVTGAGIFIPETSTIPDGSIKVDYSYPAQTDIQALLASGQEFRVVIDGLNDAEDGKPHILDAFRWRPGPTSGLSMISDKMGRLTLSGEVVSDPTKTGTGISKYVRMVMKD
jgi:hypothetical protein